MEGKKISFGFKKTKKLEKPVVEEKKDFIDCVEEQSIKVVGGEDVKEEVPLVIAMKPNTLMKTERMKKIAEEVESAVEAFEVKEEPKSPVVKEELKDETIEEMAVRELLQEAKKEVKVDAPGLVLLVPAQPKLEGQKESTLDDYESVPIQEFGLAMLRGMGWAPAKDQRQLREPKLRPKGLGLGADTVLKQNQKKTVDKDGKELIIVKNAFVKITTGKYKGCYGKVVSLDEENGRVMVDITLQKRTVSLSEFMMMAVTKSEFDMQSRVINSETYEEYKRKEQMGQKSSKHDSPKLSERESSSRSYTSSNKDRDRRDERSNRDREPDSSRVRQGALDSSNGKGRDNDSRKRDSSSSEDRSRHRKKDRDDERTKSRKRYSSQESLSSESQCDTKKKHKKEKKRKSSSDSDSSDDYKKHKKSKKHKRIESPQAKRDIDKKRKGKKKRRDRDRSPNYKKYRK